jgi:hypothetical protein
MKAPVVARKASVFSDVQASQASGTFFLTWI